MLLVVLWLATSVAPHPQPPYGMTPAATPYVPDARDPALRGLLLLGQAVDERQADACAARAALKEAAAIAPTDADVSARSVDTERRCETEFESWLQDADERASLGDAASAHAIARYVLAVGPPNAQRYVRLRMAAWPAAPRNARPAIYDETVQAAGTELRRGKSADERLYQGRALLRAAVAMWPAGTEARTSLAALDGRAHERAKKRLAEARVALAKWETGIAEEAVREALVLEWLPGSPHRADALALAVEVQDAADRWGTEEKRAQWLAYCRTESRKRSQRGDWAGARDLLRDARRLAPGDKAILGELDAAEFRSQAEARARLGAAKKKLEATPMDRAGAATDLREALRHASGPQDPIAIEAKAILDRLPIVTPLERGR